ncbi:sigma 54-interacting transcriptional regulator [Pseudomonas sp. SBB6]|uniref:sigma 54-interacting transcriptional regulator n=1 Tax=Pseudomonas sp. SBB6 TaxID=2962032 RepID=UPI0020B7212E|nr:sigma 54-interacting transcriptional regulator [Pseudomonas sp. SBB6]MCP3752962.1 sigma 54-interacting transcriptional regulator [Pseudomonas sp. SBB6]
MGASSREQGVEANGVMGPSPAMQALHALMERVAASDRPVLICGPTGAGKEVIAQRLHRLSAPGKPFIDLNCGAIPEYLLEAELFGHARGAFTGAVGERAGHLQMAGAGTLFLDEVGELPLVLQPKLLRVLETRQYRPLGSSENRHFAGRVIAATHRDLKALVHEERFREDLYYRLAVFELELPSLDARREDIPGLIQYFCGLQPRPLTFDARATGLLCQRAWPGNVRELRNLIDRIGALAQSPEIDCAALQAYLEPVQHSPQKWANLAEALLQLEGNDKLAAAENLLVEHALQRCKGNKSAAAQLLGVNRKVIERRQKLRADKREAVERYLAQGRLLIEDADFRGALPVLQKGLQVAGDVFDCKDLWRLQFELHRLLGVSFRSIEGWLSATSQASYRSALALAAEQGTSDELSSVQFGVWTTQLMGLELGKARATAQDMLQRAQQAGLGALRIEAHVAMANTLFWLGDFEESLACLNRGELLSEYQPDWPQTQGLDLIGLAITFEGLSAFELGRFAQARHAQAQLTARAGQTDANAFNRAVALQGAAWLAAVLGLQPALGTLARELEQLSACHEFSFYQGVGQILRGYHQGLEGFYDEGERAIADGYQHHVLRNGGQLFHAFQAWKRAEVLLLAGRVREALALVNNALDLAQDHQERAYLCELMLLKGRALLAAGEQDEAESTLRNALSTTLTLGSVPARLRTGLELTRLLQHDGRLEQAALVLERALRGIEADCGYPPAQQASDWLARLRR